MLIPHSLAPTPARALQRLHHLFDSTISILFPPDTPVPSVLLAGTPLEPSLHLAPSILLPQSGQAPVPFSLESLHPIQDLMKSYGKASRKLSVIESLMLKTIRQTGNV